MSNQNKVKASPVHYTVAVFDDRCPPLYGHEIPRRSVKLKSAVPVSFEVRMVLLMQAALTQAYRTPAEREKHCTYIKVFSADTTGHVLDGDYPIMTIDYKGVDNTVLAELRKRLAEAEAKDA